MFLNRGKQDGINLKSLLEDLTKQTGIRRQDIQNVDLKDRFSFLEVPQKQSKKFTNSKIKINNKTVRLELTH